MVMNIKNTTFLVLRNVHIENANAIAGLTYGFPAISNFLGFTHALSRKLNSAFRLKLGNCAVISHQHEIQAYRANNWSDSSFALTRNPLTKKGETASFVEEGRMHLTVTLIIECQFDDEDDDFAEAFNSTDEFKNHIEQEALTQRLAGGTIIKIGEVEFNPRITHRWIYRLLPGFALVERSDLLAAHAKQLKEKNQHASTFDAWLDFAALKYQANPKLEEGEVLSEHTKADWEYYPKPAPGWLVPITTGYRAISDLHPTGKVANTRDSVTPFRFVEPVYTIGQWLSPHRVKDIQYLLWNYRPLPEQGWYLCENNYSSSI
jgi:CRISPR-associated protein Csy2